MINVLAGHTVSQINKGNRVDFDNLDWETITDGWRTDKIESIVGKIKDANTAITMLDCVLSLSASGQIKPPARFVEKCYLLRTWREAVLASGGRTAATFTIPQCLQSEQAEKMLSALEKTTGYKGLPVLDRSVTPWRVSSQTDWGYVAEELTKRLNLTDSGKIEWQMWADLAGKERNRLRNAYRDSKASGGAPAGSNAILTALNRLK